MSSNNTEKFSFNVSVPSHESRTPCNLRIMTLERVNKIIDAKNIELKVAHQLKIMAAKYPQQALENFILKLDHHIMKARDLTKKSKPTLAPVELGDENTIKEESSDAPKNEEFE